MEPVSNTSSSVRTQFSPASATPRAPRAARVSRALAAALCAGAVGFSLTACGADGPLASLTSEPEANDTLVNLDAQYQHVLQDQQLDASTKDLLEDQLKTVREEWVRLCGKDDEGSSPESCVDEAKVDSVSVPGNFSLNSLQESLVDAVVQVSPEKAGKSDGSALEGGNREVNSAVLLDLAAELSPLVEGSDEQDLQKLQLTTYSEELETVRQAAHAGWFAVGVGLAKDDGTHAKTVKSVRETLRVLQMDLTAQADRLSQEPAAELPAGYIASDTAEPPRNSAEVLPYVAKILPTVTQPLREAVLNERAVEDRKYAAQWYLHLSRLQHQVEAEQQ